MTAFEILYFNKDLLKRLFELGLKVRDYKYVDNHPNIGNPFDNAKKEEFNARMNYNSTYTDVMLYKKEFI